MATQIILLVIVLASTIVGTVLNPKPWVKGCIIALAVASAAVALIKAYGDYQDGQFIKGALAAELASSKPTPAFRRAFDSSLNRVAHSKGLQISESVEKDQGILYLFTTQYTETQAGAVEFSLETMGQAYINYVSNKPMDSVLNNAMFGIPDMKNDDERENMLSELGFVGNVAIDETVPWVGSDTQISVNFKYDPAQVQVHAESGGKQVTATLDQNFVNSIRDIPAYARDWKAYQEFVRQVRPAAGK